MFNCSITGKSSVGREKPLRLRFVVPAVHPERTGIAYDEEGEEFECIVDPGGTGVQIVREVLVRQESIESYPSDEKGLNLPFSLYKKFGVGTFRHQGRELLPRAYVS